MPAPSWHRPFPTPPAPPSLLTWRLIACELAALCVVLGFAAVWACYEAGPRLGLFLAAAL